ncbi:MAG: hypothetical protein LPJ92_13650 [Rhodobacterales bacterium]|nr:hypothetical protein [Rhodobacterales bacterium]MDX5491078.1 hypothetical protein [Rhodobacterales bacterium]
MATRDYTVEGAEITPRARTLTAEIAAKRDIPEDVVLKLRQVEVLQGQGTAIADAVRQTGVTVPPSCRWRKQ